MVVSNLLWMWVYRAVVRFHATKLKVAKEKKNRAIAQVWADIQSRRDTGAAKGKRDRDTDPHGERDAKQAKRNAAAGSHPRAEKPASGNRSGRRSFCYACPFCAGTVDSVVRSGQVDHRHVCGKKLRVRDGAIAKKDYMYTCPFCDGTMVRTRRVNHRSVCSNRFYVANGAVSEGPQRDHRVVRGSIGSNSSAAQNEGRKEMQTAKLEQQKSTARKKMEKNCPRSLDTVPKLEERKKITHRAISREGTNKRPLSTEHLSSK